MVKQTNTQTVVTKHKFGKDNFFFYKTKYFGDISSILLYLDIGVGLIFQANVSATV